MVHAVCQGNYHSLGQTPAKTSSHYYSIAFIEKLLSEFFREDISVFFDDCLEGVESGLELFSYFLEKRQIEVWFIECKNLLIRPMYHSLCSLDNLEVGVIERFLSFHFLHYEEKS